MNIRLILFASALCTLSFGCEMHPVTEEETGVKDRAKAYLAARRGAKTKARRDNIIEETPSSPRLPRT